MGKELLEFVWKNKKWWMIPPIVVLVVFGALIFITTATPISPFIYVLF